MSKKNLFYLSYLSFSFQSFNPEWLGGHNFGVFRDLHTRLILSAPGNSYSSFTTVLRFSYIKCVLSLSHYKYICPTHSILLLTSFTTVFTVFSVIFLRTSPLCRFRVKYFFINSPYNHDTNLSFFCVCLC